MMRGLRLLALSLCIFIIVVYGATLEKRSTIRFGLLNSYKSLFNLDSDFLNGIRTQDELFEFIGEISKQSRVLQPLSSEYFVDDTGEMKIWSGVAKLRNPKILDVEGLEPIVDAPSELASPDEDLFKVLPPKPPERMTDPAVKKNISPPTSRLL